MHLNKQTNKCLQKLVLNSTEQLFGYGDNDNINISRYKAIYNLYSLLI